MPKTRRMAMRILDKIASGDGATKFLLGLDDDARIEAVFLRLEDNNKDSLCISSQVGCALACRFCSTGVIGFSRDLTPEEIVEQVELVLDDLGFVQRRRFDLSYMGMGEPLLNLDAVVSSRDLLRERFKDFTFYVSTVGVTAGIRELARRSPDFGLQISLHAPTDELRSQIMPINRAHPIAEPMSTVDCTTSGCSARPATAAPTTPATRPATTPTASTATPPNTPKPSTSAKTPSPRH
ncbi:MAG TPA: radical SAM protein [Amycolatopsis sp.]|jgi:23S rRNA (adenine2503-C2)-methyltransferase|nr:radical SAM protein [Amycolatopsis sp.]